MQEDYILIGNDLTGIWLQPGFVEGIVADGKHFVTLEEAYRHIFRRNLEYGVLLWNGIPVRFSYPEDTPAMVEPLVTLLGQVQQQKVTGTHSYAFRTPNLDVRWLVEVDPVTVTVEGFWHRVPGHYEAALNRLGIVRMARQAFLCEWKMLLSQLIRAFVEAEAMLTTQEARNLLKLLQTVEAAIPTQGRFYQY